MVNVTDMKHTPQHISHRYTSRWAAYVSGDSTTKPWTLRYTRFHAAQRYITFTKHMRYRPSKMCWASRCHRTRYILCTYVCAVQHNNRATSHRNHRRHFRRMVSRINPKGTLHVMNRWWWVCKHAESERRLRTSSHFIAGLCRFIQFSALHPHRVYSLVGYTMELPF